MSGRRTCVFLFSTGQCLDIGSSVMGDASSTPIGATDQPLKYPTGKNGFVFMFPTTYVGLESWPALLGILKQSISGCSLCVRQLSQRQSYLQKMTYHLSCCHSFFINPKVLQPFPTIVLALPMYRRSILNV